MPPPAILHTVAIPTPAGEFQAHFSADGLVRLDFPKRRTDSSIAGPSSLPAPFRSWAEATKAALEDALADGKSAERTALPPLDLAGATPFRRRVWAELRRIPRGVTQSYGEIAEALGKRRAARAVGGACGANPVPVLIPCHRVLAANGRLGGFSGGLEWKRRLLASEGVLLT